MGMTSGWLSQASAERFIIEQRDSFDDLFCPNCVEAISTLKCKMGNELVFCIVVVFDGDTKHFITEADVRFMTGEQTYVI